MIHTIVAYFDKDTQKFNPAFLVPFSLEDTVEQIKDGVIKGKIENAEAFTAFHLGYFDTANGKLMANEKPVELFDLAQYVRKA